MCAQGRDEFGRVLQIAVADDDEVPGRHPHPVDHRATETAGRDLAPLHPDALRVPPAHFGNDRRKVVVTVVDDDDLVGSLEPGGQPVEQLTNVRRLVQRRHHH